jgi:predicted nucleic acid-binding protein
MTQVVVSNSSPLIGLTQIQQLDLLESLFGNIIIPQAVANETAQSVKLPPWISIKTLTQPIATRILATALGPGESEAISLALEINADLVILDDRAARRLAQGLGLKVIGILGILLAAKNHNLISSLRPHLDNLINYNFHLAPDLYQKILSDAGE